MEQAIESRQRYTIEEYLRLERDSEQKHEYWHGRIVAMAGGTPKHSLIAANVIRELGNRLKGKPCRVYDSNLRVRIPRKPICYYPDAAVICGPPQFDPEDPSNTSILNPRVIVEVLSPSTERHCRTTKLLRYCEIESFEEYVLVTPDEPVVETFLRKRDETGGMWSLAWFAGLDAVARIRCLGLELPLAEIYAGVEFPAGAGAAAGA